MGTKTKHGMLGIFYGFLFTNSEIMSEKSDFHRRPDSIGLLVVDKWLSFLSSIFNWRTFIIIPSL